MSQPSARELIRKRILVVTASGLAIALGGLFALKVQAERAASPTQVAEALGRGLGLRARVGATELDLFSLQLVARDVALDSDRGPVLRAKLLRVRPSLAALLRGRVDLRSLELDRAVLTLREGDLPDHGRAPSGGFGFETLVARDARLRFESQALGTLQLERASLRLGARGDTLAIAVQAGAGTLERGGVREALGGFEMQGEFAARALRLGQLALQAHGARLALRGVSAQLPLGTQATGQLVLDAELARLSALGLLRGVAATAGRVHAEGRFALANEHMTGEGRVQLEHARVAGLDLGEHADLGVRTDAQGVQLSGSLPLGAARVPVRFTGTLRPSPERVTLEPLTVRCGKSELHGRAELGTAGHVNASIAGDAVDVAELAPLLHADLARAELRGRGHVELALGGTTTAPEPRAVLSVKGFGAGGIELGDLEAALAVQGAGKTLRFERAALRSNLREATAQELVLQLDAGLTQGRARVNIARLPLADLYALLGAARDPLLSQLQGSGKGSAEVELAAGGIQRLDLALELSEASLDDYRFDGGKLRARFAAAGAPSRPARPVTTAQPAALARGAFTLQELALRSGGGTLALSGEIGGGSGGALDLAVRAERLPLERMPWMRAHLPQLAGVFSGSGRLHGASQDPRADLDLSCDALQLGDAQLGRVRLRAQLLAAREAKAGATAQCRVGSEALARGALGNASGWLLCGEGLSGKARLDLAVGTTPALPLRGVLEIARFDLGPFLPERKPDQNLRGELEASLRVDDGSLAAPEQISGVLAVRKLAFGEGELAFANTAPFEITIARGELSAAGAELRAPKAQLALSAGGNLKRGVKLSATGKAAADLLTSELPGVRELHGDLAVKLEIDRARKPLVSGEATLADGFGVLTSGAYLRRIEGALRLEGEQVQVRGVRGQFGGGVLGADGTLALQGVRVAGYELALSAEQVAFEPQERLQLAFDAHAKLQAKPGGGPPKLVGKVQLHRLVYGRHVQFPEALIALNRDERATQASYDPARDKLRFELDIEHDDPVVIHNNFLDADVSVAGPTHKLRLAGSDQRFGLLGKLEVVRGRVLYRGDEFQITRAAISFDDPKRIAPSFELRAVAERKKRPDANIVFSARGDRDAFGLEVACDAKTGAPPPFTCDFAQNKLRCDSFDELVRLWVCRAEDKLSSAP